MQQVKTYMTDSNHIIWLTRPLKLQAHVLGLAVILMILEKCSQLIISRWWQLKHVLFSSRKLGKWSNFTNIFQMGWNHQLDLIWISNLYLCGDGQLRWKDTPILAKKTWSASKNATPPDNDRFRGSFTSVSPESPDHYVGWVRGMIWCFFAIFSREKKQKRMYHHCMVSQNIPKTHVQFVLIVFWSIWKWSRRSSEKKNAEKHNVDLETWQATATKTQVEIVSPGFVYCDFLLSTILDDLFPTFGVLLKKWPRFRGQDFLGKVDVFTDWDPMGWKSPSNHHHLGDFWFTDFISSQIQGDADGIRFGFGLSMHLGVSL